MEALYGALDGFEIFYYVAHIGHSAHNIEVVVQGEVPFHRQFVSFRKS